MKKILNIEALKKKKQKNVQEQNAIDKHNIMRYALAFRNNRDLPNVLIQYFEDQGIDTYHSILTWYDRMPYGEPTESYRGDWLTPDYQFYSYEIFLDKNDQCITDIWCWKNITDQVEINAHQRATGKSGGLLCIEVLNELNDNN